MVQAISSTHVAVDAAEYRVLGSAAENSFQLWEQAQGYKRELGASADRLKRSDKQRNWLLVLWLLTVMIGVMGRFWL